MLRSPVTLTFSSAAKVRDFLIGVSIFDTSSALRFLGGQENDDDDDDDADDDEEADEGFGAVNALRMACIFDDFAARGVLGVEALGKNAVMLTGFAGGGR